MANHVSVHTLVKDADQQLQSEAFRDYCPNGLQVEGRREVRHIVSGVTASLDLIEEAIVRQADMLLVHHGYFWKGEAAVLTGMKGARIKALMNAGINLVAYHLPLDAHPVLGNNAQLAERMGWRIEEGLDPGEKLPVGFVGSLEAQSIHTLVDELAQLTAGKVLRVGRGPETVRRIAWCTGAAQSMIYQAAERGVDVFVSGEISEQTVHAANELGLHYIAAGHHATERYGVEALGNYLAQQHGITHEFVDLAVPV